MSYWTYPCSSLKEAGYALLCIWRVSWLRRTLFYFSATERMLRWHFQRAEELGCDVYCMFHGCDAQDCAAEHD